MEQINKTVVPMPSASRYRNTRVYKDMTLNQVYFGSWKPPKIIEKLPVTLHIVVADEMHRPDLISFRVYARSDFFWAIALRNGVIMPVVDLAIGQSLVCPHIEDVLASLSTSSSLSVGAN
jgi:hypothetical protein